MIKPKAKILICFQQESSLQDALLLYFVLKAEHYAVYLYDESVQLKDPDQKILVTAVRSCHIFIPLIAPQTYRDAKSDPSHYSVAALQASKQLGRSLIPLYRADFDPETHAHLNLSSDMYAYIEDQAPQRLIYENFYQVHIDLMERLATAQQASPLVAVTNDTLWDTYTLEALSDDSGIPTHLIPLLKQARTLMNEGNLKRVKELLNPEDHLHARVFALLGDVAYLEKKYEVAATYYNQADDYSEQLKAAQLAELYLKLSKVYNKLKNPENAKIYARNAREIAPYNSDVYVQLGVIHYNPQNPHVAIDYYLKALDLDPNNHLAYYNLGLLSMKAQPNIARNYFLKASQKSDYAKPFLKLGELNMQAKKYRSAIADFQTALARDPSLERARRLLEQAQKSVPS